MDNDRSGGIVLALIALLIGGIVGFAIKSAVNDNSDNKTTNNNSSSVVSVKNTSSNLRTTLNADMREHVALALPLLRAQLADSGDVTAATAAMEQNTNKIAADINSIYSGKQNEFATLWRQHIGYYTDYVNATKNKNEAAKQTAKNNLTTFSDQLATFFADVNNKFNKTELKESIAKHGTQTLTIIDQLAASNYSGAYTTANEAYQHMGDIADALTEGIVKQSPNKY